MIHHPKVNGFRFPSSRLEKSKRSQNTYAIKARLDEGRFSFFSFFFCGGIINWPVCILLSQAEGTHTSTQPRAQAY